MNKEHVHFILVRTQFASNLGAAARVMKNMGFKNLVLIQPECEVGVEARMVAMKGASLLDQALFYPSLEAANQHIRLLVGTTARLAKSKTCLLSSRTLALSLKPCCQSGPLGIVFGPEDNGLRRKELRFCQWLVEISTGSEYSVLNLAQAVAMVAYDLHVANQGYDKNQILHTAKPQELQALFSHLETTLLATDLPPNFSLRRLLNRLNRILVRAQLEKEDVKLLRNLLTQIEKTQLPKKEETSTSNDGDPTVVIKPRTTDDIHKR